MEKKKRENTKGRKRRAQVLGFNTLNFCLGFFFSFVYSFEHFRLFVSAIVVAHTLSKASD